VQRSRESGFGAFEQYRPNPIEADDIEPAYEEASRSLNTGRLDYIPTLRPSGIWRDRPSPVPPTNANGNGGGARPTNGASLRRMGSTRSRRDVGFRRRSSTWSLSRCRSRCFPGSGVC